VKIVAWALERRWPRHPFHYGVLNRWSGNGGMLATNSALNAIVFHPAGTMGMAYYCSENDLGLLNQAELPVFVDLAVGILLIDFAMWGQHWLLHRFGFLWRAHQVHHADLDLDFTTAFRFHPLEMLYTITIRMLVVAALGAPILAAVVYEVVVDALGTLSHASLRIPTRVDAALRWILVTPDLHRVHHSAGPEMNHNYAVVFPIWDRMLGTYQAQPEKGHVEMELGLPDRRDPASLHYFNLMLLPFRSLRGR